jgi:hypothetical protein
MQDTQYPQPPLQQNPQLGTGAVTTNSNNTNNSTNGVTSTTGNWFSDMSMNKKIALCIIVAVIIIFILVLVVRYYNSQPIVQQPQQTPLQPPQPPGQYRGQPQQSQMQPQQMQQPQQTQMQPQVQPSQQPQQQNESMTKNEALEALEALKTATSSAPPAPITVENVVGRSITDITQLMSNGENISIPSTIPAPSTPPAPSTHQNQLSDYCDINSINTLPPNADNNIGESTIDDSERCSAITSAGKPCRLRIKANGKCHLHLD